MGKFVATRRRLVCHGPGCGRAYETIGRVSLYCSTRCRVAAFRLHGRRRAHGVTPRETRIRCRDCGQWMVPVDGTGGGMVGPDYRCVQAAKLHPNAIGLTYCDVIPPAIAAWHRAVAASWENGTPEPPPPPEWPR